MIVVADAGPIHYLILLGQIHLLRDLFQEIVVPGAVRDELTAANTPTVIQSLMRQPPGWIKLRDPREIKKLRGLDAGESAALFLATEMKADLILCDDMAARRAARSLNFRVAGTLAVLEEAAAKNLTDLPDSISKLRTTNFYISENLLEQALSRDRLRRGIK
jgi:predicted nucleic acid-binding protein